MKLAADRSKPAYRSNAAAGNDHRLRDKANQVNQVKKGVAAFGGPIKPHKPLKPNEGLAGKKQPREDRRPNSMSTIERKRGVEGMGLKLPKIGAGDRRKSDHAMAPNNKKPFAGGGAGGMMSLLNKKGGPVKVAYEAEEGVEPARNLHSPVNTRNRNGGSVELRGESEYIAIGNDDEGMAGMQLDKLLHKAKNARGASDNPGPGKKGLLGGKVKSLSKRAR